MAPNPLPAAPPPRHPALSKVDFLVEVHGPIVCLTPATDAARIWMHDNFDANPTAWIAVGLMSMDEILYAIMTDPAHLTVGNSEAGHH